MQTYELVMIGLVGTAVFVGLSAALYSTLPAAVLEYASRHGRYLGLGTPIRLHDSTAGEKPVTAVAALQGQTA